MGDFDDSCLGDGSSGNPRSSLGDARGSLGEATTLRVENKGTLGGGEYRRHPGWNHSQSRREDRGIVEEGRDPGMIGEAKEAKRAMPMRLLATSWEAKRADPWHEG
ncbi:unnamed protein product [Ilex paraguariensis]|uniref:Uncharacterized protein n=1 Tax=Ilex paraguariensis TaxID=185542 RepID=A0ABC8TJL4_9AQUA